MGARNQSDKTCLMSESDSSQLFFRNLADVQRSLYAHIFAMLPSTADAKDVLQQTNVVLLEKQNEYDPQGNFAAWAGRIAYFEVLAHRKRLQRDRLYFDDELVRQLAEDSDTDPSLEDPPLRALGDCLKKVSEKDRNLLERRYSSGLPAKRIAGEVGRSVRAISQALYRIRMALMRCIEQRLANGVQD